MLSTLESMNSTSERSGLRRVWRLPPSGERGERSGLTASVRGGPASLCADGRLELSRRPAPEPVSAGDPRLVGEDGQLHALGAQASDGLASAAGTTRAGSRL